MGAGLLTFQISGSQKITPQVRLSLSVVKLILFDVLSSVYTMKLLHKCKVASVSRTCPRNGCHISLQAWCVWWNLALKREGRVWCGAAVESGLAMF